MLRPELKDHDQTSLGMDRDRRQKKFGRTAETLLVSPIGGTHYDSMQARLQRRFSEGFSLDVAYTSGKSITNSGKTLSDIILDINIPEYYRLNPDGSIRDLNGFAEITTAGGERQFRFGLRISF